MGFVGLRESWFWGACGAVVGGQIAQQPKSNGACVCPSLCIGASLQPSRNPPVEFSKNQARLDRATGLFFAISFDTRACPE